MPWIINNNIKVTVEFEPESDIKVCVVRDGKLVVVKSSEVFPIVTFHLEGHVLGGGGRSGQGWGQTTDPSRLGASLLLTQVCQMCPPMCSLHFLLTIMMCTFIFSSYFVLANYLTHNPNLFLSGLAAVLWWPPILTEKPTWNRWQPQSERSSNNLGF